ncbi:BCL-6 corepressor-like [Pholidichthys leucotaenia]
MNPLAALSIDRSALVGENLRTHGGIFYPAVHPLSAEKPQEPGTSLPLGYNLMYKPDVTLLDSQKNANGYAGLYKNPPPGLQKPLLVPAGTGGDGLGLDRRVAPSDKQSELGLNGAGGFLRLPWISPYTDATMYPFLDMAYKASFLSQPSPFIHHQLAYQSLCATGAGGSTSGEDRLFYLNPYAPAQISSPLGPQIRISTANPAPAVMSPLSHSQDKSLQNLGSVVHQEPSAFSTSPQIHLDPQAPVVHHSERQHGSISGTKSNQTPSNKNTVNKSSGTSSCTLVSTSVSTTGSDLPPVLRQPSSATASQSLSNNSTDLHKPLNQSTASSSTTSLSVSHHFFRSSEHCSPINSGSSKTKEATLDRSNAEKSTVPIKTSLDKAVPQKAVKHTGEKPLDLSAKELEGFPNEFPSSLEALAKLGYLPSCHYRLLVSQDQQLKERLPPPVSTSAQTPDHSSTRVAPGPFSNQSRVSQTGKSKSAASTHHQQLHPLGTPASTAVELIRIPSPASGGRPAATSPSSKSKVGWLPVQTAESDLGQTNGKETHSGNQSKASAKPEVQESQPYPQQQPLMKNENSSSQMYGDNYLPPGIGYSKCYIPYSVAENMSLQRLPVPAKGPVYPHPLLLGSSSFYPSHIAPKHGLPYGAHQFAKTQEMTSTPLSTYPGLANKDHHENRSKTQDNLWNAEQNRNQERQEASSSHRSDNERDKSSKETVKTLTKTPSYVKDDIVCIDLVRDEPDDEVYSRTENSPKHCGSEHNHIQDTEPRPPKSFPPSQSAEHKLELLSPTPRHHQSSHSSSQDGQGEISEEVEDSLSPFPDIPEEETLRCARTSPHQFSLKFKRGTSAGPRDACRSDSSDSSGVQPQRSTSEDGGVVVPTSSGACSSSDSTGGSTSKNLMFGHSRHSESQVCSRDAPSIFPECEGFSIGAPGGVMNSRASIDPKGALCNRGPHLKNVVGHCSRNLTSRPPTCEPTIVSSPGRGDPCCLSSRPESTNSDGASAAQVNTNLQAASFRKSDLSGPSCGSNIQPTSADGSFCIPSYGNGFTQGLTSGHFSSNHGGFERIPADPASEPLVNQNLSSKLSRGVGTKDSSIQDHLDPLVDEDDDDSSSKNRLSGLAKRIANSSGYVGDLFRCVTTELYSDSSKLSREQRALQRAMLRFSELELKEKEGGGEREKELADGQQGDGGEEKEEEGGWEGYQQSEGRRGGGGGTPTAAAAEAPRDFHPSGSHSHLPVPLLLRDSIKLPDLKEKNDGSTTMEEEKNEAVLQEEKKESFVCPPEHHHQSFISTSRSFFSTSSLGSLNPAIEMNRRRIFSLEPFHQSSISSSRLKRGREDEQKEEELEEEDRNNKRTKISNESSVDDVKKLKVCIELNGLRLNKPRLHGELGQWLSSCPRPAEVDGKFRGKLHDNKGWHEMAFMRKDGAGVFYVAPPTSSHLHLPRRPGPASSSPSSRLQDKHQRLREGRRVSTFLPVPPSSTFSFNGDDDPDKPKGKRPCKMKHTGGGGGGEAEQDEGGSDDDVPENGKVSPSDPPRSPRPPSPPSARPVPPEVRRLIVNKNAGETLLQRAARLGYEEVVLYCLDRRVCDVNHRDNAGFSALHEACARGWLGIVRHLVEHGANVNCSAQDGTRPLHDAVENDHMDVVRFLLACGADPTLTSYSGRGPINMTHSAAMETFLEDYLCDLRGRSEGDPGICWEFYGSAVCEPAGDGGVYNILADPPGPEEEEDEEEEEEDQEHRARREVFEFELSDRPLLPCYNIQVSQSQGPRNWLLLSDVLGRLRMTSRSFRRLFPQLNVQCIPEDEFYRQASLSQLLTGPDEQELASFRPDVKDPLELVEATPELAGMLGSSLEFVDSRWDSLEASPPLTPSPPPTSKEWQYDPESLPPPPQEVDAGAKVDSVVQTKTKSGGQRLKDFGCPSQVAKMEAGLNANMWEPQNQGSQKSGAPSLAKLNVTVNVSMWEPQRTPTKNPSVTTSAKSDSRVESKVWEQQPQQGSKLAPVKSTAGASVGGWEPQTPQSRNVGVTNPVKSDSKVNSGVWEQPQPESKTPGIPSTKSDATVWEFQRLRTRNTENSDTKVGPPTSEPPRLRSKNSGNDNAPLSNGAVDANMCKRQNQGSKTVKVSDSANPSGSAESGLEEPQRLRSKNATVLDPPKPDSRVEASTWEHQGLKGGSEGGTAPKREAKPCENQGAKTLKIDPAWQRSLASVRVHIRDLGMKVGTIRTDLKKEVEKVVGKGTRVKPKS